MSEPLLDLRGLSKRYGGVVATDAVDLTIVTGEVHAIIGPNGAGKTSLVSQIAGEISSNAGRIIFDGKDVTHTSPHRRAQLGLRRSFQVTSIFPTMSVRDNVGLAFQAQAGHSFRFWRNVSSDCELCQPADALLHEIGLSDVADHPAATISYGKKRALDIAMVLAGTPRLLLLDEPTAGMGPAESAEMVSLLAKLKRHVAILLVEHDMDAVFSLADRVTVLVYGKVVATGRPEEIRQNEEVQRAYLGGEILA